MPSLPIDSGWDFGPVLDLIDFTSDIDATSPQPSLAHTTALRSRRRASSSSALDEQVVHLGNFGKLFEELDLPNSQLLPAISLVEPELEDLSSSDDAPAALSALQPVLSNTTDCTTGSISNAEAEKLAGDDPFTITTKAQRQARKKERKALKKLEQQQEKQRKDSEVIAKSVAKPSGLTPKSPTKQSRNPSKSNVGAKIRPATPSSAPTYIPGYVEKQSKPLVQHKITARPAKLSSKTPSAVNTQTLKSLAPPFTPGQPSPAPHERNADTTQTKSQAVPPASATIEQEASAQEVLPATPTPVHPIKLPILARTGSEATPQHRAVVAHGQNLIPRTVHPIVIPRTPQPSGPQHTAVPHTASLPLQARPPFTPRRLSRDIVIRPKTDRHLHLFEQLITNFPEDKKWMVSPMQLCNEKSRAGGIHCFVDASNIMIGFRDKVRRAGVQHFEMSFDSLALLMERRRPVAKRVFAGSHREAAPMPHVTRLVETSRAIGYENNVKEQVYIRREDSERKRFFKEVERVGWTKAIAQSGNGSGSGSDSEMGQAAPATPSAPKWVEQGVDEILHLKMCQSIIDTETPTTMVLATGDGNEAEMSDGFLAHVERALKTGWQVELVSWRQQTSGGYKNKKFRERWKEQFRLIELDDYVESLVDTP